MNQNIKPLTRRDFVKVTGCAAMGMAFGLPVIADEIAKPKFQSKVVLVRRQDATDTKGNVNSKVIRQMLGQGITALFDHESPEDCWKQMVRPDDVVGIKSNVWGPLATPPELEQAIQLGLIEAGVHRGLAFCPTAEHKTHLEPDARDTTS